MTVCARAIGTTSKATGNLDGQVGRRVELTVRLPLLSFFRSSPLHSICMRVDIRVYMCLCVRGYVYVVYVCMLCMFLSEDRIGGKFI